VSISKKINLSIAPRYGNQFADNQAVLCDGIVVLTALFIFAVAMYYLFFDPKIAEMYIFVIISTFVIMGVTLAVLLPVYNLQEMDNDKEHCNIEYYSKKVKKEVLRRFA
jgi:predicted membrane protein